MVATQAFFNTVLLISLLLASPSLAYRLLLYPMDHLAHVNYFSIIGEELANRGHTVDMIVANRSQYLAAERGIHVFPRAYEEVLDSSVFENAAFGGILEQRYFLWRLFETSLNHVRHLFDDETMMEQLQRNNYDLVIVEGAEPGRYQLLLPYKLNVPFIVISHRHYPWLAKIPALPSVEGFQGTFVLGPDSTFIDRIFNTVTWLIFETIAAPPSYLSGMSDNVFDELLPEKENIGFTRLLRKSEMFLILMDTLCTEHHRVSAPHYQFIGGLGARDPKPLPRKLQAFMDSASEHGVIVMTFGSGMKRIRKHILEPVLEVFKALKQKVIIRHDDDISHESVPSNVLIQNWLPQNDLLAHPNTKLFITHGGPGGQTEAVYHGVAMLMMPMVTDQFYNARRAQQRGYGLVAKAKHFDVKEFRYFFFKLS